MGLAADRFRLTRDVRIDSSEGLLFTQSGLWEKLERARNSLYAAVRLLESESSSNLIHRTRRKNMSEKINASTAVSFVEAITICMSKFADFKGRASRSEYWWFYLFALLLTWGSMLVDSTQVLSGIINLVLICPVFAVGARRLHDTNRSGWWQLLGVTIIGLIPLIIWLASEGKELDDS